MNGNMPPPPKPAVRLVVALTQRTIPDPNDPNYGKPQFHLLVVGDEN